MILAWASPSNGDKNTNTNLYIKFYSLKEFATNSCGQQILQNASII